MGKIIKVVILGDIAVGKTLLCRRYGASQNTTIKNYGEIFGVEHWLRRAVIDGTSCVYVIWELSAHPRFADVRLISYRGASGVLLVYDVTRKTSCQNINSWVREFYKDNKGNHVPMVLVGNKIDLRENYPGTIPPEKGEELASELTARMNVSGITVPYIETSAKKGINVGEAFTVLARNILKFLE